MLNIICNLLGTPSRQPKRRGSRVSSVTLAVECLQDRIVPSSAPIALSGSHLLITGTPGNDHVEVSQSPGLLKVNYNGADFDFTQRVRAIVFSGDAGDDFFSNSTSIRTIARGGAGADTLIGGNGNDKLYGDAGNDDLQGGGGNDLLDGGFDDDLLHGGDGKDSLRGGDGNDDLSGDEHNDRLSGDWGDDNLHGGTGRDSLRGGLGDDHLDGDLGHDSLDGGPGDDIGDNLSDDSSRGFEIRHAHDANELVAELAGAGTVVGKAKFEAETEHGVPRNDFEVELAPADAGQTYDILVDGVTVAQVTTTPSRTAELHIDNASFLVVAGSTIVVKDSFGNTIVQGTFGMETEDSGTDTVLLASLTGASSAFGSGKYQVESATGVTTTEFEVRLKSGPVLQTLTVKVDGNAVGQFSTGDSGNGDWQLSDPTFTVVDGSTLEVVDALGAVVVSGVFHAI